MNGMKIKLTNVYHELHSLLWSTLPAKRKAKFTLCAQTGRLSKVIPAVAPFDFGINREWFNAHKGKNPYRVLLEDWDKYGDPEGFGSKATAGLEDETNEEDDPTTVPDPATIEVSDPAQIEVPESAMRVTKDLGEDRDGETTEEEKTDEEETETPGEAE